jgi:hypothetical protein
MLWPPQARPVATVDSSMSEVIPVGSLCPDRNCSLVVPADASTP